MTKKHLTQQEQIRRIGNTLLTTTGGAGLVALMFYILVMSYDSPKFDRADMEMAKKRLELAEIKYESAHRRAILNSTDTLMQDMQYLKLKAESEKEFMKYSVESAEKYLELARHMDTLGNRLQEEHISKNKTLIMATKDMKRAQDHLANLQQDSVRADSVARIPVRVRFQDNWKKMRQDFHAKEISRHTVQLQKLQNQH